MAVMTRDSWTDERLDDLSGKVDRLDGRMEAGFRDLRAEMTTEFRAIRTELGALNRSIQQLAFGLIGAVLLGFLGTIAAILTLL